MDDSPAPCAPAVGWDVSWILMLLLTAGQGFTILALSIMLWRQRVQGAQCRGESLPPRGKKRACGCEAEGWAHILPLYPISLEEEGSKEYSCELSGNFSCCTPYGSFFPDASIPHFKPEIQVYENIHVARFR